MYIVFWEIQMFTPKVLEVLGQMKADVFILFSPQGIEEDLSETLGSEYTHDSLLYEKFNIYYIEERIQSILMCQIPSIDEATFVLADLTTEKSYTLGFNHDYLCDVSVGKEPRENSQGYHSLVEGVWQPYYYISVHNPDISATFHNKDVDTWIQEHPEWKEFVHLPVEFSLN